MKKFIAITFITFFVFLIINEVGLRLLWEQITLTSKIKTNVSLDTDKRYYCTNFQGKMKYHNLFGWTEFPNSVYFEFRNGIVYKISGENIF